MSSFLQLYKICTLQNATQIIECSLQVPSNPLVAWWLKPQLGAVEAVGSIPEASHGHATQKFYPSPGAIQPPAAMLGKSMTWPTGQKDYTQVAG